MNTRINSVQGYIKLRNIERDPRVALAISHPDDPTSHVQVRGRVVDVTTDGAADHIEALAQQYLGTPSTPGTADATRCGSSCASRPST